MTARLRILMSGAALAILMGPAAAQTGMAGSPPESGSILFSRIEGADITGADDQGVAILEDVIVDGEGRVVEYVLGEGGVLGIGRKLHRVDRSFLPALKGDRLSAPGLTKEQVAGLPTYEAVDDATAPAADSASPPVSGANQQAPQKAIGDIPVPPAALNPRGPAKAVPEQPEPPPPAITATPWDNSAPQGTSSVQNEKSAAGSGDGGMAPQQGTGTGATQNAPGSNENEARTSDGNPAADAESSPEQARHNQEFGRDRDAAHNPMPQSNAEEAATRPGGADAAPAGTPVAAREESLGGAKAGTSGASADMSGGERWSLGSLVDADVHGLQDAIEIEDFRIENGRVVDVILSKSIDDMSEDFRAVSFEALDIAGPRDDPEVALNPSVDARPVEPVQAPR